MGIDYSLCCECCGQEVNIFSFTPRITYNHTRMYKEKDLESYEKLKTSKSASELLGNVLTLAKHFPSTDRNFTNGDYYLESPKNASIGLNSLLVWLYCNLRQYPKARISIWY